MPNYMFQRTGFASLRPPLNTALCLMTIKSYLKRRGSLLLSLIALTAIGMMVCGFLIQRHMVPPPFAGLAIAAFVFSFIPMLFFFRCPSCNGNLGSLAAYFGPLNFLAKKPVCFCPFCGVNMDQPLKSP